MNEDQSMQVFDVFGFARRRGKLIAIIAGSMILATFWICMALPNQYLSSAMILVEPQSIDENLVDSGVADSKLNERLGLMTAEILSRSRLSAIIDKLDLYKKESEDLQRSEVIDLMRSYVNVEPVLSELEAGTLSRNRELSFNTFRIIFRDDSAYVARDVAQLIAQNFINANIESRTEITAKSLDFMQDEIRSLSIQIEKVEKAVAAVKEANPGRLPEDLASNQRLFQFSMGDLRDAQRVFDAATTDAAFWKNQAAVLGSMGESSDSSSPVHRLRSLELERGHLLARGYTNKHPDVIRVESEIALIQAQLSAESLDGEGIATNPTQQNAVAEQRRSELRAASAADDIERLRESIAQLEQRIAETPGVAERLDALSRQYDHQYRSFQDFSSRLQRAGVQADLERRQLGERFRILESAFIAPEPMSPNRILLLILGAVFGLVVSFGVGLVAEMVDTSVHSSNDLQSAFGIPVLVSVPKIMLESDRADRSRRIMREFLAAAGVVVFCLVGGILTYYLVNVAGSGQAVEEQVDGSEAAIRVEDLGMGLG